VKLSHTRGTTTLEPGYDHGAGTVSFAATQRISKKSTLRASYDQKGKQASVEWSRQGSDEGGPIKVSCAMSHSLRNVWKQRLQLHQILSCCLEVVQVVQVCISCREDSY
jgi:hypothetical protein